MMRRKAAITAYQCDPNWVYSWLYEYDVYKKPRTWWFRIDSSFYTVRDIHEEISFWTFYV